jgi:hypothetical protein
MRTSIALAVALMGCSEEEPTADAYKCAAAGGAACFELPTRVVEATDASGADTTPVLDCAAYEVTTANAPITFTGRTVHAVNKAMVPLVHVELFADLALTMLVGETISDETGNYTFMVDGLPSQVFVRTMGTDTLPSHQLYERFDVTLMQYDMHDFVTTTRSAVAAIVESVGDLFATGKTQVTGVAYDCNGNRLVNVVANIAPSSAAGGTRAYEEGVRVYYYGIDAQNTAVLNRRAQASMTRSPGSFVATNLASGKHYVQVWGYPDDAALANGEFGLVLLGEAELRVPSMETAAFVSVHSRR